MLSGYIDIETSRRNKRVIQVLDHIARRML